MIRTNLRSTIDFDFSKDGEKILLTTEKGSCSFRKLPLDSSIVVIRPDGKIEKQLFLLRVVTKTASRLLLYAKWSLNEKLLSQKAIEIF